LQLNECNADGYRVAAYIFERSGRDRQAIGFYEKALELRPGAAEIWRAIGSAYQRLGEVQQAERCFARALAL
jgi:tetratricopeptide (TPR) repeat protein